MSSAHIYANALDKALNGAVNASSDTFNCALVASSYTPDYLTDQLWSDISAHEAAGTGYDAGGQALTGVTTALTAADDWGQVWEASTAFPYQTIVVPSAVNGFLYLAASAGETDSSEPDWPVIIGETVSDGSITWLCVGTAVEVLNSDEPEWNPVTIDAAYAVVYDENSGVLLSCQDFGGTQELSDADFIVNNAGLQGWYYTVVI